MIDDTEILKNRAVAFRWVYVQLIVTLIMAIASYALSGLVVAYSVLLGGTMYILPNFYFMRCVFGKRESQTPQSMVHWFYLGEVLKILLTIGLFALCFALVRPLHVPAVFATYIVIMAVNLIGMASVRTDRTEMQN